MLSPTAELQALRAEFDPWYRELGADHLAYDRDAAFPAEKWELVRRSGLLRLPFDPRWGGRGLDLPSTMYVLEGLGAGCRDGGLSFSVSTHIVSTGVPLHRFGSDELKARYLPGVCDGTAIGAHAITDPGGGSDVLAMGMTAKADGDYWRLDGEKAFVTNGPIASILVVYAVTDRALGPFGLTAFLVERDTPGLLVGPQTPTMGLRTAPLGEVSFQDCRVPAASVLGRTGLGFTVLDHVMKWEILCSFIINVGEMRHRLARCLDYAKERSSFGRPIGSYQSVANHIVDMKIGVETASRLLYDAAIAFVNGADVTTDVALAKLVASEANVRSALAAVQIFGGRGYLTETGLEKDLRDAVGGTIYSGTSEIMRTRIARMLGLAGPQREKGEPR
ncbi:MAG: acyl-CoA dehydrogenase family protein [Micromonosporaceae bacterium]